MKKILIWFLLFGSTIALSMDINGQLKKAQLEVLASDPTSSTARIYYNSVSNKPKYYNGTSWLTITDTSAALTNPMTTQGDLIYEDGVPAANRLARGTATQVLHSGTTPSWSAVSLTADVSGITPVANGGTGLSAGTSGGVPFYSAPGTIASSSALATNQVAVGGGTSGPSTGGSTYIVGAGEGATPSAATIRGSAAVGTNIAGATLSIDASNGTGSGGSGQIQLRTAAVGGSGSGVGTLAEYLTVRGDGNIVIGSGDATTQQQNGILRGANAAGSNVPATAATFFIMAPNGTGTKGSGTIVLQTAPAAASSSTPNTMATALTISNTQDVVLGPDSVATTTNGVLRGGQRVGSNVTGSNLFIDASNGTGTGGSGTITIRTAPAAASSSTPDTQTDAITIANTGAVTIGNPGGNVSYACTRRTSSTAISSSSQSESCSTNEIVVGGGCEVASGTATSLQQSYPSSTTAWQCNWSGSTASVRAYALCCKQ